ncbi:chromosome segregation protein SMC [Saccharophagus degradans]|uniref:Chromosome partition protein Smc n=1 Tax=Saccharophagus degradans (strain 2-40 / ATCC 43961 / DSM 17024) TaxID=203122 RepID=Q21JJ0_SACD2|nr:chromosome segregation protein SMC [Saccharophagus degradans]ABD81139.1 condensin subunit Smc [Saccharophagus degradans 2-40]
MRLKSIKLAGFKSFVDPTTVNFPSNLCSVVGPNGCGKSNIIDAVRWVMGESSAKNLRGESMTDVIFNGSGGRKPVGQASIELIFDNSDATITGEYAGFNEISIKRKVTREAQNFYYLNGSKCRRRDITDIFLGTGLGPRSYAIIEQGMISKLIEAKPEELRVFIEEAAGISKYKERRRDTENRMRRTHENLERLTDIREELERQLLRLERQAQAAEKYTEFKKEERQLKADLQALRYQKLKVQADQKQNTIRDLELSVEAGVTEQVKFDAQIEKFRSEHTDFGDAFNEVQGRFYSIGADIARIEQTIQHAQERERQLKVDLEQTERDCREAEEHLANDTHKAEGWEAELLEIEPDLGTIKETEELSAAMLLESEEAMQHWQQEWDQFNQTAAEPRQQAEVQQSRIKYLDQVQQRLLDRIRKLESERENLVVGDVEEDIEILEEELGTLDLQIEEKAEAAQQVAEEITELRERQQKLTDERDQYRSELQTSKGRFASLEALHQAAMGESGGAVSEWLETQGLAGNKRLAENLDVETGWEKAAEVVLGSSLQAVCVDSSLDTFSDLLNDLTGGELLLIEPNAGAAYASGAETLASKIKSSHLPAGILAGVLVAEDLTAAMAMRSSLTAEQSIVTKDGLWLSKNWLRVIKASDANDGIIARKQEMETLRESLDVLEEKIETITEELESVKLQLSDKETQRDSLRSESEQIQRSHGETRAQLSAKRAKVEQVLEGRERTDRDIKEAKEQLSAESENLVEARAILEEAILAMETDTEKRESLLSQRDDIRSKLDNARQQARHDRDRAHELAMRAQSVKTQLESIKQGIQRLQDQMQRMQERRETLRMALEENRDPVEENKLELEALLEKRVAVEEELNRARQALETVETSLRDVEKQRHQVEQQIAELRMRLESSRLEAQTFAVKSENLRQQLLDDDFDLENVLANLDESLTEENLEQELERIANRISRLGAINLAAIEEYKIESERKLYLDSQNEDLREALETLENAIKKIDRETRTRFKETFDQVNSGLQELFPKVFGGGHAYLELTGEDMLDTGIAIMARPPGKKNSTIHLLSGGEKALTAIALVFSIFRLNPAPFCMLDEVDAPLDDANVGRYARMVEEMSKQVQFIYITHNKIAMEMAHQLLGVTMHEPGVSRMVTVDVDEAAELAAS